MKRYGLVSLIMLGIFIITAGVGVHAATVKGTRHDLSMPVTSDGTGPGPIQSSPSGGTTEICVFCHTPHGAASVTSTPLWNKSFGASTDPGYQIYTSDVLTQLGYTSADMDKPLPSLKAVHLKSRICLTCHDGTIALGNLANWPTGYASDIPMVEGVASITNMPAAAEGYIGVDLRDDHPVAIKHTNSKDPELNSSVPVPPSAGVKVFPVGLTDKYVECTSCHDPHDDTYKPFLVEANTASAICTKCHNAKAGFTNSIHDTSTVGATPPPVYAPPYIGSSVGGVKCMNCHYPHKAAVSTTINLPRAPYADLATYPTLGQYLLALREEMTCYNETNRWGQAVSACHGPSGYGKDIKTEVEAVSGIRHRVKDYIGKHQAAEHRDTTQPGNDKYGWVNLSGGSWHVECDDCHNSHTAMNTNHSRGSVTGNSVSSTTSPLRGAGGVSVGTWPTWAAAAGSYTYIEPVGLITIAASTLQYEYEICFKCHSDFAWGDNTLPPAASTPLGSTNTTERLTNQALEFGTNSVAYHPVANTTTAAGHQPATPQGTYSAPWNTNAGNQTMYCSDCHTKEGDGTPTGPHGSTNSFILRAPYSDTYSAQGTDQSTSDVCFQCHPQATYFSGGGTTGFSGGGVNLHTQHQTHAGVPAQTNQGYKCVNCHTRVPHGWWRKGMIIVRGEGTTYGAQYEAGGANQGLIQSIVGGNLPASGGYQVGLGNKDQNCTTVGGCH